MNAKLNTADLSPATGGTVWSDYDGDETYGDFTVSSGVTTNVNAYEPGVWRKLGATANYLHGDLLGTLRQTTGTTGSALESDAFTADNPGIIRGHHTDSRDAGGNRTAKYDYQGNVANQFQATMTEYHYDVDNDVNPPIASNPYGTFNNRLEYYRVFALSGGDPVGPPLSTTWYYYTKMGNVRRIVTKEATSGGQQNAMAGGEQSSTLLVDGEGQSSTLSDEQSTTLSSPDDGATELTSLAVGGEGGGGTQALLGGGSCTVGDKYTATRFEYARNAQTVTHILGESWCWVETATCETSGTSNYKVTFAREFRYDGARARYMNRKLQTSDLFTEATNGTTWTDYDGDSAYSDFTIAQTGTPPTWTATNTNSHEPGAWRRLKSGSTFTSEYLHSDLLGTLRQTTTSAGAAGSADMFTAFGERVTGGIDRHGYVGAHGYQTTTEGAGEAFSYLHLGARYYDPASGRFLQRDPIGIGGGSNVYAYLHNRPTSGTDATGLAEGFSLEADLASYVVVTLVGLVNPLFGFLLGLEYLLADNLDWSQFPTMPPGTYPQMGPLGDLDGDGTPNTFDRDPFGIHDPPRPPELSIWGDADGDRTPNGFDREPGNPGCW